MSKIDELIKRFCPDGVQFKQLGQVGIITIGEFVHKNKQNPNGKYPVYNGGTSYTGHYDDFNNTANKIVISARGANAGFVNKVIVDYWAGNSCYSISFREEEQVNWLFAFYYLKHNENKLIGDQQKGGIPAVSKKMVQDFLIPIPALAIQEEIVKILDTFTTLEAVLEAELEARKKQYTFYRDSILSFEGKDVEWKKIKEVFRRIKGTQITATKMKEIQNDDGEIRVFAGGKTVINAKEIDIPNSNITRVPSVLVQSRGVIDFVYFDKPFTFKNEMWAYTIDNVTTVKYLYYYLKNNTQHFRDVAAGMGALPQISLPVTEDFVIPVPSISEQEHIVRILDKFDALVNDISIGLPAEIEARKKQYEYYRNQLLTFNSLSNE